MAVRILRTAGVDARQLYTALMKKLNAAPRAQAADNGRAAGSGAKDAGSGKKNRVAKESGMAEVRLVEEDIRPRDIVTQEMLELAVRVGLSVGGSTNMTLHMPAIAHEAKLHMSLEVCGRLSAETP